MEKLCSDQKRSKSVSKSSASSETCQRHSYSQRKWTDYSSRYEEQVCIIYITNIKTLLFLSIIARFPNVIRYGTKLCLKNSTYLPVPLIHCQP